jgi:hypothetical protein
MSTEKAEHRSIACVIEEVNHTLEELAATSFVLLDALEFGADVQSY